MVLKFTGDELEIMRTALEEYCKSLRQQSRPHCAGRSNLGVELCVKRMNAELLLEHLEQPQEPAAFFEVRPKLEPVTPAAIPDLATSERAA
jgi:hypothetical protein